MKSRCNFDSFLPEGYCCVGWCHFFAWQSKEKRSVPLINSQVLHVLEIIAVHQLKIIVLESILCLHLSPSQGLPSNSLFPLEFVWPTSAFIGMD